MQSSFYVLLFVFIISLQSCNGKKSAHIETASPNGKVAVKIDATRGNSFDPFKVEIAVIVHDFTEGKLLFEIIAGDLNNQNVKFNWADDNNCIISIEENDRHVRSFQLVVSENQVQLAEI